MIFLLMTVLGCAPKLTKDDNEAVDTSVSVQEEVVAFDSCSQALNDHPCNFTLTNSQEEEISLYDFYGKAIVLDLSAMWCAPCNSAADEVQAVQDEYGEDLAYITVLIDNYDGEPPTTADCALWETSHGITTAPVLCGDRTLIGYDINAQWPLTAWPTFFFIDQEMIYRHSVQGFNSYLIDASIDKLINDE